MCVCHKVYLKVSENACVSPSPPLSPHLCACVCSDYPKPSLIFILAFFKANLVLFGEATACSFTHADMLNHSCLKWDMPRS